MSATSSSDSSSLRDRLAAFLLFSMAMLAAWSGTGHGPPVWWAGVAAWLTAVVLWPRLDRPQKRVAALLMVLGSVAFAAALARGGRPEWVGLLTQNTALLGMLAAVSFLQLLGAGASAGRALPKGRLALWRTAFGVHLLGAVINLSAIFIMAERIGNKGQPSREQVALLSRAYLAAALWSPFFAATAVAMTYAPGANPARLVAAGTSLSVVLICLGGRDIIRSSPNRAAEFVGYPMHFSALLMPGLLALIVGLGHWLFPGWAMLSVISFASLLVVAATLTWRFGPLTALHAMANYAGRRLPAMAGELALFLAAGCFASGLSALMGTGGVWLPFTRFGVVEAAIVLAIMILLAAVGIHTVISIAMAAVWLAPVHPNPTLLAMVFVQSWAIGLAAGPTSGTNLTIQGKYGIPATAMARMNVRYCLQAYGAAVLWLLMAGVWLGV